MLSLLMMIDSAEDRNKFEKIYIEYKEKLYYITNSILFNEADAEDVVHDAFIRIINIIDTIDDPFSKKTRGLVYLITRNLAIDKYRKRKRYSMVSIDDAEVGNVIGTEDFAEQTISAELIKNCLGKLSQKNRDLLILRYYIGFSEKETADVLHMTEVNVRKSVYRAKKKLELLVEEAQS